MQDLRFIAVGGALVRLRPAIHGQRPRYVGRDASGAPSITSVPVDHARARHIVAQARGGHLTPADEYTACVCGLPFSAPKSGGKKAD